MREARSVKVARLAYHVAQETLPRYSHPKSPSYFTLPQLTACVLLKFYLNISYRGMERWLYENEQVRRVLELRRVPHHTTLRRTVKILRRTDWLKMQGRLWTGGLADLTKECPPGQNPSQAPCNTNTLRNQEVV